MSSRRALVTGLGGQDGGYLAELLVGAGWELHGLSWGRAGSHTERRVLGIDATSLEPTDSAGLADLVRAVCPTHVFHLAGVSSVWQSWQEPVYTTEINALCTAALFDACLATQSATGRSVRVVNAASGEIFAGAGVSPQSETTPIVPTSPYGVTKAFGFQ